MYLRYHAGRTFRHAGTAIAEGALIVGIAGALVFGVAVVGGDAPTGAESALAARSGDSAVWIDGFESSRSSSGPVLPYGSDFRAGYSTRAAEPWGFAQCWANESTVLGTPNQGTYSPGDVIWSQYRALYSGGPTSRTFQLIDPIQGLWLGGGADCKLSLIKFSSNMSRKTVLATTTFAAEP